MGARRKKNRTHLKGPQKSLDEENVPKSFVIRSGQVTKSVTQLVRDVRQILEPHTATRLRERPNARLRDYLTIAPTLKVTHLLAFTLTEASNVHMRMARLPQGPTLTFRVMRYSLMKDMVQSSLRGIGKAPGSEYRTPPLLVLNNFSQQPGQTVLPQLRLMSTMFQGLFPAISIEKSALPTFRRVLLISYNPTTNLISMRHYTITVRAHGVSRRVRRLLTTSSGVLSSRHTLSNKDDIADYLLRRVGTPGSEAGASSTNSTAGYETGSETDGSEAESDTNAVELPDDYGRGNRKGDRKAVRLVETGPRMELRLVKVVEGLVGSKRGEGETVFHEFVQKSKAQTAEQKKEHEERRKIRDQRRAEQAANVARKKAEADAKKAKKDKKGKGKAADADADGEGDEDEDEDEESLDDGADVDVEGLSDVDMDEINEDPEEALERHRSRKAAAANAKRGVAGGDDFDYEDGDDSEDDFEDDDEEIDWDAEDVAEESEEDDGEMDGQESSEDDEGPAAPPPKRPFKGPKKVAGRR